jgi:RNA polymerase sigma-70 factor (ECF subfamily)
MHEEELINKLKEKDEHSFRVIFEENKRKVINTCFRIVNNTEIAEDLTQEVFIKVYQSVANFRGESKLSTWIFRIAVSKSLDYLRSQKRKKRFALLKSLTGDDKLNKQISAPENLAPDIQIDSEERMQVLKQALDSLSENQRIAFSLSKYDEMSYQEIANIMDTSVSSIESLIFRAKKNLRKKLYNYYKKNL